MFHFKQRSAWQEAVSEMKLDIDNKLDRMELDPLKSYLDNRIKSVGAKMVRKVEVDTSPFSRVSNVA